MSQLRVDLGFLHSFHDALDFADEIDSPWLGVVLELNNAWIERGLYGNLATARDRIAIVQVNDFKVGTHGGERPCRHGRWRHPAPAHLPRARRRRLRRLVGHRAPGIRASRPRDTSRSCRARSRASGTLWTLSATARSPSSARATLRAALPRLGTRRRSRPSLLVHGNGGHAHWWAPLVPALVPGLARRRARPARTWRERLAGSRRRTRSRRSRRRPGRGRRRARARAGRARRPFDGRPRRPRHSRRASPSARSRPARHAASVRSTPRSPRAGAVASPGSARVAAIRRATRRCAAFRFVPDEPDVPAETCRPAGVARGARARAGRLDVPLRSRGALARRRRRGRPVAVCSPRSRCPVLARVGRAQLGDRRARERARSRRAARRVTPVVSRRPSLPGRAGPARSGPRCGVSSTGLP